MSEAASVWARFGAIAISLLGIALAAGCESPNPCPIGTYVPGPPRRCRLDDGGVVSLEDAGTHAPDTSSGLDAGRCGLVELCVESVPGWEGPFELDPLCAAPVYALHEGLEVSAGECTCSCGGAMTTCPSEYWEIAWDDSACTLEAGGHLNPLVLCADVDLSTGGASIEAPRPDVACGAGVVSARIPPPEWAASFTLCAAPAGGSCGAGACVPATGNYCVVGRGDCPETYPVGHDAFESVTDERRCPGDCACAGSGAGCSIDVTPFPNGACGGTAMPLQTVTAAGSCLSGARSVRFGSVRTDSGVCLGARVDVLGDVLPTGAHTVCCQR